MNPQMEQMQQHMMMMSQQMQMMQQQMMTPIGTPMMTPMSMTPVMTMPETYNPQNQNWQSPMQNNHHDTYRRNNHRTYGNNNSAGLNNPDKNKKWTNKIVNQKAPWRVSKRSENDEKSSKEDVEKLAEKIGVSAEVLELAKQIEAAKKEGEKK